MKLLKISVLLILGSTLMSYKCCYDYDDKRTLETTPEGLTLLYNNYYYYDSYSVVSNVPYRTYPTSTESEVIFSHWDEYYWGYKYNIEVRLPNGWSNVKSVYKSSSYHQYYKSTNVIDECSDEHHYYVTPQECTSPPTYLHLVLSSLDDVTGPRSYYQSKSKRWAVTSIVDESNTDMSTDPDWSCMADNEYIFHKNGTVRYIPGTLRCDAEADLNTNITIYYTVNAEDPTNHDNPGDITMSLSAPGIGSEVEEVVFTIETSSFTEITGWTTNEEGETVLVTLEALD